MFFYLERNCCCFSKIKKMERLSTYKFNIDSPNELAGILEPIRSDLRSNLELA